LQASDTAIDKGCGVAGCKPFLPLGRQSELALSSPTLTGGERVLFCRRLRTRPMYAVYQLSRFQRIVRAWQVLHHDRAGAARLVSI